MVKYRYRTTIYFIHTTEAGDENENEEERRGGNNEGEGERRRNGRRGSRGEGTEGTGKLPEAWKLPNVFFLSIR